MDCSVVATRHPGLWTVSTMDFFYPLVEDPYLQGRIACCNVLSDLYAMGVRDVDTMLMILGVSTDMTGPERDMTTTLMMKGFNDTAEEAETNVTGGQTVLNPWPTIGGQAASVCSEAEFIRPNGLQAGDVMVLTKPLGTQVAVNCREWLRKPHRLARVCPETISEEGIAAAFDSACESMARLNRHGAALMHKHGAHGATDVTGFGIVGHATNMAEAQATPLAIELSRLPVIRGMLAVDRALPGMFKLEGGLSAETSGGLLVALPSAAAAEAFCREAQELDGQPAWVVGRVLAAGGDAGPAPGTAFVAPGCEWVEVDALPWTHRLLPAAATGQSAKEVEG